RATADLILERLVQLGVVIRPRGQGPVRAVALAAGAAALLAGGWWLGRPQLGRWQLQRGDDAWLAYAKQLDQRQLQKAAEAWQQARTLDPSQPDAHARLGFLADIQGRSDDALAFWRHAAELTADDSPQAKANRNGLANVLAQLPGQRQAALDNYDADRDFPRSALEAAMLRWPESAQMPRALDAINEPALARARAGDGTAPDPWGFKENDELLLFESRAQQRCLLTVVQATTAHLAGTAAGAPPLASPDCKGVKTTVRDLLCHRLSQAATNPRAPRTARWLACPASAPASSAPPQPGSTG
ncbi:MAG: hypothetical protein ACKOPS_14320, partial [Cyanobium sp.]